MRARCRVVTVRGLLAGALLLGGTVVAPAAPAAAATAPDCRQAARDAAAHVALTPLPAPPTAYATPRTADGGRRLLVLVTPPAAESEDAALLERVRAGLESGELEAQMRENIRAGRGGVPIAMDLSGGDSAANLAAAVQGALQRSGLRLPGAAPPWTGCPGLAPPAAGQLYQVGPELRLLRDDLPPTATALVALDLDGDGVDELLLEHDGDVDILPLDDAVGTGSTPHLLFHDDAARLRAEEPRDVLFPPEPVAVRSPLDDVDQLSPRGDRSGPLHVSLDQAGGPLHLRVTDLGALRLYGPAASPRQWQLQATVPLPMRTLPGRALLLMAGPEVRTIGRDADGVPLLAAGPVPYGDQRLRTLVLRLGSLQEPGVLDIWSRLEPGEEVQASGYLVLDHEPYLWVRTENTQEVEFFGDDEAFHLYHLTLDRTRAGVRPVLSFAKIKPFQATRLWSGMDVDGDGMDDLVAVGRQDGGVVLSAYLRKPNGSFRTSPQQQKIPTSLRALAYGDDLDGDGLPDLRGERDGKMSVHAGLPPQVKGGKLLLVADEATWRADLQRPTDDDPAGVPCRDLPVLEDLDGDGLRERMCWGEDSAERPYFKVVRFTTPSPDPRAP